MRPVVLSRRLRTVAGMVTKGNRVCDVGCDHGFVPVYLVQEGISPGVLAMDLREGPLRAAREHVSAYGLEEQIETRLSDGLHNYRPGEADTLVCAGMGGGLMIRILEAEREKTDSFRELVLQPQSEIERFRRYLRENGYRILDEEMVVEDGRFYQMIRAGRGGSPAGCGVREDRGGIEASASPAGSAQETPAFPGNGIGISDEKLCKLEDRYGPVLLRKRTTAFLSYLEREATVYEEILANLREQGLTEEKRKARYAEVEALLADNRLAESAMLAAK